MNFTLNVKVLLLVLISAVFLTVAESRQFKEQANIIENSSSHLSGKDCQLNALKDIPQPDPLLLIPGTTDFYQPDAKGIVQVPAGESIELYCEAAFTSFSGQKQIIAQCAGGDVFTVQGKQHHFSEFACKDWQPIAAERSNGKCSKGATLIDVGFYSNKNQFVKLYEICHDEKLESTLYSHHFLQPYSNINHRQQIDRVQFTQLGFFSHPKTDSLYTQYVQQKTIGHILGGNEGKYFDIPNYVYLARGHLNAKTDYIYPSQQRATFLLLNVAPQWQTFNAGNWVEIENGVRSFAGKNGLTLEVYTGTWGVGTLADSKGNKHELYLNNKGKIPVPKLYYKVVIDTASKKGIVFVGVNNPHLTLAEIKKDYIICDDIGNKINWLKWKPADIATGYSYACEVGQFSKAVNSLPNLNVKGILY